MGWTVGFADSPTRSGLDRYLLSLGKALYIASEFEGKCHFVLRVGRLAEYVSGHETIDLDSFWEFAGNQKDPPLGRAIDSIEMLAKVKPTRAHLLNKGRKARNHIAHQAGRLGRLNARDEHFLGSRTLELQEHVACLLAADNVVSQWVYGIEEKHEPLPQVLVASYEERMLAWVFPEG